MAQEYRQEEEETETTARGRRGEEMESRKLGRAGGDGILLESHA